jgi:mannose-6-phosphate isomerase-like protein (cupin superfamily)
MEISVFISPPTLPPLLPPSPPPKKSFSSSQIVPKIWGYEIIFANNELYCGKILHFFKGSKGSLHYHVKKTESWYISSGCITLVWINGATGEFFTETCNVGDTVTHKPGECHCVEALEETEIFEVSTPHYDDDSYRIFMSSAAPATPSQPSSAPPSISLLNY